MASQLTAAFDESPRRKGEKNESGALWALSEPVRRLMYNRADAGGGELGRGPVWGRCCMLGGGKLAEGSRRRGKRKGEGEEQACKLCDDYPQTQGPSVLRGGAGARGCVTKQVRGAAREPGNPGRRGTDGVGEGRKDKMQKKRAKKKESKRQKQGPDDVTATSDRVTEVRIGKGGAAAHGPAGSCPGHGTVRYGAQSAEDRMPPSIRPYG